MDGETTPIRAHEARRARERATTGGASDPRPALRLAHTVHLVLCETTSRAVVEVAGRRTHAADVALNTALVAGSDVVRLAAKLVGHGEAHAWVDGPDRAWCADLVEEGLRGGVLRRTVRGGRLGWEDVVALPRGADDGPVVTETSGGGPGLQAGEESGPRKGWPGEAGTAQSAKRS